VARCCKTKVENTCPSGRHPDESKSHITCCLDNGHEQMLREPANNLIGRLHALITTHLPDLHECASSWMMLSAPQTHTFPPFKQCQNPSPLRGRQDKLRVHLDYGERQRHYVGWSIGPSSLSLTGQGTSVDRKYWLAQTQQTLSAATFCRPHRLHGIQLVLVYNYVEHN